MSSETPKRFDRSRDNELRELAKAHPYGLISYNSSGEVRRVDIAEEFPHEVFTRTGWSFYTGAGYYDDQSNLAEAYINGVFTPYPDWHIKKEG